MTGRDIIIDRAILICEGLAALWGFAVWIMFWVGLPA